MQRPMKKQFPVNRITLDDKVDCKMYSNLLCYSGIHLSFEFICHQNGMDVTQSCDAEFCAELCVSVNIRVVLCVCVRVYVCVCV